MSARHPAHPATPFVLGYGTNGFTDHPLEQALDVLAGEGYGALALTLGFPHLDPFAPDADEQALRLRARLDDLGWRVVVETGTRFLLDPWHKHRPTLLDDDAAARVAYLRRAVEIGALLRADAVSFFSGVVPAGLADDVARERLLDRLPDVVAHARVHGVPLALEPEPGMLVETVADALAVRRDLGEPAELGITVDLGHCVVVEPDGVEGALRAAAPWLRNVQVDDMRSVAHEHLPFGDGELDVALALRTLADVGYTGVAAVELPRHSFDAPGLAHRSMTALAAAWDAARPDPAGPAHPADPATTPTARTEQQTTTPVVVGKE